MTVADDDDALTSDPLP